MTLKIYFELLCMLVGVVLVLFPVSDSGEKLATPLRLGIAVFGLIFCVMGVLGLVASYIQFAIGAGL